MATTTISNVTPFWSLDNTRIDASDILTYSQPIFSNGFNKNKTRIDFGYDQSVASVKKNNAFTKAYNVAGVKIKCEEEFENNTQKISLRFHGKDKVLDKEVCFDEAINVDTDIYNRYDWSVKNGILYVTLYEKINPRPDFKRVKKESKKVDLKEDKKDGKEM